MRVRCSRFRASGFEGSGSQVLGFWHFEINDHEVPGHVFENDLGMMSGATRFQDSKTRLLPMCSDI